MLGLFPVTSGSHPSLFLLFSWQISSVGKWPSSVSEPIGEQVHHSYPVPFVVMLPSKPEEGAPSRLKVVHMQIIFYEMAECRFPRASRKDSSGG